MPGSAIITKGMCENRKLAEVSILAALSFDRLLTVCDDFGRFRATPSVVKSKIFPLVEDLSYDDIRLALNELAGVGLIMLFGSNEHYYGLILSWHKYQSYRRDYRRKRDYANGERWHRRDNIPDGCMNGPARNDSVRLRSKPLRSRSKPLPSSSSSSPPSSSSEESSSALADSGNGKGGDKIIFGPDDLMELYNQVNEENGKPLPVVTAMRGSRRDKARLRLKEHPAPEFWHDCFRVAASDDYYSGRDGKWRNLSLDWLLVNDANCVRLADRAGQLKPRKQGDRNMLVGAPADYLNLSNGVTR